MAAGLLMVRYCTATAAAAGGALAPCTPDAPQHTHVAVTRASEALTARPGCCDGVRVCVHALRVCVPAEFHVSETPCGRVTDPKKLASIKQVLSLPEHTGAQQGESVSSEAA